MLQLSLLSIQKIKDIKIYKKPEIQGEGAAQGWRGGGASILADVAEPSVSSRSKTSLKCNNGRLNYGHFPFSPIEGALQCFCRTALVRPNNGGS